MIIAITSPHLVFIPLNFVFGTLDQGFSNQEYGTCIPYNKKYYMISQNNQDCDKLRAGCSADVILYIVVLGLQLMDHFTSFSMIFRSSFDY